MRDPPQHRQPMVEEPARPRSILEDLRQTRPFHSRGQEAYLALVRTADDAKRGIARVLDSEGITLQQYNVLRILRGAGEGGVPTLTIGERMVERTPGVTRILDRMEKKGWVVRRRCTEDRRRVWCRISEDGLKVLDRLEEPVREHDRSLTAVLDPEELDALIGALDRLREHFRDDEE